MSKSIVTKTCTKCKIEQPTSNFHKDVSAKSGLCFWCKTCRKAHKARYRKTPQGKLTNRRSCAHFLATPSGQAWTVQYRAQYRKTLAGKMASKKAYAKRYKKHRDRVRARMHVHYLVRIGRLPRPKTLMCPCGAQAQEYHHHKGYSPEHKADVIPLCIPCHKKEHRRLGHRSQEQQQAKSNLNACLCVHTNSP